MFYLSTIIGAKVVDSAFTPVGVLKDVIAGDVPQGYGPLRAIKIQTARGSVFIPWQKIESYNEKSVYLTGLIDKITYYQIDASDLLLKEIVLDHQIVDMEGARVVRANDLQLGVVEGKTCVVGIDISLRGILRRLKLEWLDIFNFTKVQLIDWRQARVASGSIQVASLSKNLVSLHPADIANVVEDLNLAQGTALLQSMDVATASKVFEELDPETRTVLMDELPPEKTAQITERMPVDELVDLLKDLPPDQSTQVVQRLQRGKAASVDRLMRYKDDTAGGLMTTDILTVRPEWTVPRTIEEIKMRTTSFRSLHYVYVTDGPSIFFGVISLRRLILADPAHTMQQLMRPRKQLRTLKPNYDLRRITTIMTKYNLMSIAVLDKHTLAGVVTIDDVMRALTPDA